MDAINQYCPDTFLKRRGSKCFILCPFHPEKTASCLVDPEKNTFHCFGCHAGGDQIDFYALINHVSNKDAILQLANQLSLTKCIFTKKQKERLVQEKLEREKKSKQIQIARKIVRDQYSRLCWLEGATYKILQTIHSERDLNRLEVIAALKTQVYLQDLIDQFLRGNEVEQLKLALFVRGLEI